MFQSDLLLGCGQMHRWRVLTVRLTGSVTVRERASAHVRSVHLPIGSHTSHRVAHALHSSNWTNQPNHCCSCALPGWISHWAIKVYKTGCAKILIFKSTQYVGILGNMWTESCDRCNVHWLHLPGSGCPLSVPGTGPPCSRAVPSTCDAHPALWQTPSEQRLACSTKIFMTDRYGVSLHFWTWQTRKVWRLIRRSSVQYWEKSNQPADSWVWQNHESYDSWTGKRHPACYVPLHHRHGAPSDQQFCHNAETLQITIVKNSK